VPGVKIDNDDLVHAPGRAPHENWCGEAPCGAKYESYDTRDLSGRPIGKHVDEPVDCLLCLGGEDPRS
jgi:hypothetical protein